MATTIKQVRTELQKVGVSIRKTDGGDYCVRLKGSPSGHGYFTTDLTDALYTGQQMAKTKRDLGL